MSQKVVQIEIVILTIFGIWLGILTFVLFSFTNFFKKLVGNSKEEDFKAVLESIMSTQVANGGAISALDKELSSLKSESIYHIQKIGIVRFNPFRDMGGDHSFSLAILDGNDTGVVITGLHTRERTRVYMKTIKNGKGEHDLSAEEKKALSDAKKS